MDENRQNEFFIEVNRNPKDPKSNDCQLITFIHPDGSETTVKREHLMSMIFAFGTEDQQKRLIPQKISQVRFLKTVLGIRATKAIAKGEMINIPVDLKLPSIEEEVIGSIKQFADKHSKIWRLSLKSLEFK